MTLYFQDKTVCLSRNQGLTLCEGDSILNAQPVKIPQFKSSLTCKQTGDRIFLLHFFNVHIMNVNHAKFQKKFDAEQFQGKLP